MSNVNDRRSVSGAVKPNRADEEDELPVDKLRLKSDGSIRRSAGGGRSMGDYFSEANRHKPMVRGELLGFMEWYSHQVIEGRLHRRVWRWLTRKPGPPVDVIREMSNAYYERQVVPTAEAIRDAKAGK